MKLYELQSPNEVVHLEQLLDRLFYPLGLDVKFTAHFIERLLGREQRVTIDEITKAFQELKSRYKTRLIAAKRKPNYEAILKDLSNDLNIVFGIKGNQLVNITIKQKDPSSFVANVRGGEEFVVGAR